MDEKATIFRRAVKNMILLDCRNQGSYILVMVRLVGGQLAEGYFF